MNVVAESLAVVGYLVALVYAVIASGTYVGLAEYGLVILAGMVLGILARRSTGLRSIFLVLLNASFFFFLYWGVAFFLGLFNLIPLASGNVGFSAFWVPFGAYWSLNLVYTFGFGNRKHRYVFSWIDDQKTGNLTTRSL